jgi:hypothetical protein
MVQFLDNLANDVMPELIDRLAAKAQEGTANRRNRAMESHD